MYVVKNFIKNGNIVLQNMDTNELEKKSVPRDQLKKFQMDKEMKSNMTTTLMTEAMDDMTTVETTSMSQTIDAKMTSKPKSNMTTTLMTEAMDDMTTVETTGMSPNIHDEMTSNPKSNMKNDTVTNMAYDNSNINNAMDYMILDMQEISHITEVHEETVFTSDEEDSFLPASKCVTSTPISQKMEIESNIVLVTQLCLGNNFTFKPLTLRSREEIGPRLLITQFNDIQFKGIGEQLCGPSNNIHYIKGDGNCYF